MEPEQEGVISTLALGEDQGIELKSHLHPQYSFAPLVCDPPLSLHSLWFTERAEEHQVSPQAVGGYDRSAGAHQVS